MGEPKPEKPYRFDTIPKPVSPTDYAIWGSTLWDYLKATPKYNRLLKKNLTWTTDEDTNRGFEDDPPGQGSLTAAEKSNILESILLKIGTYGPKSVFIDIRDRSTSYKYIWNAIRRVCGFPVPGAQLIQYMCLKNSFDPNGSEPYNDHYWKMRDAKILSLMTKDGGITFDGKPIAVDEDITPSMENQVVADWLESIGGIRLVKYIGQEYSKELEKMSLFDLQESLGNQETMRTMLDRMNMEETAKLNRAEVADTVKLNRAQGFGRNSRGGQRSGKFNAPEGNRYEERLCYFCKELKNGKHLTHNTRDCFLRQKNQKKAKGNQAQITQDKSSSSEESDTEQMSRLLDNMRANEQ